MHFIDHLRREGRSAATIESYGYWVRRAEGGLDLRRASGEEIARWADTLPYTAASRNACLDALRAYWRFAKRRDPPTWAIRAPKRTRGDCRAVQEEAAAALEAEALADGGRKGVAVLLGLYLALRTSEVAGLPCRAWIAPDRMRVIGKGPREDVLPVHPVLRMTLDSYARSLNGSRWFFPSPVRGHVTANTIYSWVREIGERAGVPGVFPHALRHTAIATVHDATGQLRVAQQFARHAHSSTTERYTRVNGDRLISAVEAIRYGELG